MLDVAGVLLVRRDQADDVGAPRAYFYRLHFAPPRGGREGSRPRDTASGGKPKEVGVPLVTGKEEEGSG